MLIALRSLYEGSGPSPSTGYGVNPPGYGLDPYGDPTFTIPEVLRVQRIGIAAVLQIALITIAQAQSIYAVTVTSRLKIASITIEPFEDSPMPVIAKTRKLFVTQGNTQVITVEGLQDDISGDYIDDASSVTASLVDELGNVVVGCDEINLNYVASSNGNYQGSFGDASFYPDTGTEYRLLIDGTSTGGTLHVEILVEVIARRF